MTSYRLLPVEATPGMEQAAERYWNEHRFKGFSSEPRTWKGLYKAMCSAVDDTFIPNCTTKSDNRTEV